MKPFWGIICLSIFFCKCANRVVVTDLSSRGLEIQISSKTPEELINKWMWSFEEDKADGVRTYRPESYDFPPSRGRTGAEILKNGKFISYEIGPNDKPIQFEGQWVYDKKSKTIEITFKKTDIGVGLMPIITENRKPLLVEIISFNKDIIKARVKDENEFEPTKK